MALTHLASCTTTYNSPDKFGQTVVVISVADQKLAVYQGAQQTHSSLISTAKSGVGEDMDSGRTPRGLHQISEKVGAGNPLGMVFVAQLPTGEIIREHIPGRWPVTTRILRLSGLEARNQNTFERLIYIHGSPLEHLLGKPASGGCIRMRASEVIELFDLVNVGVLVYISEASLSNAEPMLSTLNAAGKVAH